jgi:TRAP-type C4-dicarboxylate transport system substrate-binding protein
MPAWSLVKRSLSVAALGALVALPLAAQAPITIRLATGAPVNSSWHKALLDMGAAVNAKTSGRVRLTVYAGGTQGDEASTIRMMRPGGSLNANLLTISGLSAIDNSFDAFGMPFFFQNDDETRAVLQKLTPTLDQKLEAKGFHRVAWGSAGWVQLFSKTPVRDLDELKKVKLFTSSGDDRMVQWYKSNGFNPVALSANDIPAQLKLSNGLIEAAPSPPYPALMLQMFRDAKYMLDVHVAPLLGALVISNHAWTQISAADQKVVADAAAGFETKVLAEAPKLDADSVNTMKTRGLTVITLDPKARAGFHAAAEKLVATMRGGMVPADVYDMVVRERDAFRKTKGR